MRAFRKIAIANRGEVAVRIINACKELGIETVLLHSEADKSTKAYRAADEAICIGPSAVGESYLSIQANIQGAMAAGADAVHPGFGFLSENADFAEAVESAGMTFIGPSAESIRLFGDKISAKRLVQKAGGPVIPGFEGDGVSMDQLIQEADRIGYPVICKAAAGGGGRGLKVIHSKDEAKDAIEAAQREGKNAFGDARVFLEKYLDRAKHIEFQIFGDASGKVFSLLDRECSVQRRHQKVIEEALSADLPDSLREKMSVAAIKIGQEAKYKGAGTVEFLVQDGQFYFLEMNTRLQVEHPVTELVLGVDLVKAQILTAQDKSTGWDSSKLVPRGHSIECRIYAEDSYQNGLPSTGPLGYMAWPYGPGRRFEVGFETGDAITEYYDSMMAKVIVWDESRPRAIEKMREVLKQTVVFGVQTNIGYLLEILSHEEFVMGTMTTKFIETYFPTGLTKTEDPELDELGESLMPQVGPTKVLNPAGSSGPSPFYHGWRI